ncbi:hypothetical protein [Streptomyces sp. A012304]|uniref:hypothetical protein n=1 Tax=Streptomyces sp. A012304 TaxID=375446 RepID=UPI002232156C|nr:hypothetical protein [Streptomyces sp. A012304]GKQ37235.1 hypothetical protein ALMP_37730 [Streptomyces sp. A012304]
MKTGVNSGSGEPAYREAARRVADLLLTDDAAALDALPERARAELLAPLFAVSRALDEQRDLPHLRAAVDALRSAAAAARAELPGDLRQPIEDLRFVSARQAWAAAVARAGLFVVAGHEAPEGLMPPGVANAMFSMPASDRLCEAWKDVEDPRLREKANADWYRLSVERGLFRPEDPRFHLASDIEPWICVELRGPWDIMGEGAAGPLGSAFCRPEFRMLSLDGNVLVGGTTSQFSIGTVVVTEPHRAKELRDFAEHAAESEYAVWSARDKAAARRWLELHPADPGI